MKSKEILGLANKMADALGDISVGDALLAANVLFVGTTLGVIKDNPDKREEILDYAVDLLDSALKVITKEEE